LAIESDILPVEIQAYNLAVSFTANATTSVLRILGGAFYKKSTSVRMTGFVSLYGVSLSSCAKPDGMP
jgi:hypothetical protein